MRASVELDFGVRLAYPEHMPETVAQKVLMSSSSDIDFPGSPLLPHTSVNH